MQYLRTPPAFGGVPVRILPSTFGTEKTRMMWLSTVTKILKIRLFVSTTFTNVMDGQTPLAQHHAVKTVVEDIRSQRL